MKKFSVVTGYVLTGFFALTLLACQGKNGGSAGVKDRDQAASEPMPTGSGGDYASNDTSSGSIGTRGGGGTVVFTFKQGAIAARQVMESVDELPAETENLKALSAFYAKHRTRWQAALKEFSQNPDAIKVTEASLKEAGITVGAESVPAADPRYVRLSVPYLTGVDGFTEAKAFALAVHEAGHFAAGALTETEHDFLDQIGVLLYQKRPVSKKSQYVFKDVGWTGFKLTSDGRILTAKGPEGELVTVNLESGDRLVEVAGKSEGPWEPSWPQYQLLDGDRVLVRFAERKYVVRNQRTNQVQTFQVAGDYYTARPSPDQRSIWLGNRVSFTVVDLKSGHETPYSLHIPDSGRDPFDIQWVSRDLKRYARQDLTNDVVPILSTGDHRVLDFVRMYNGESLFGFSWFGDSVHAAYFAWEEKTDRFVTRFRDTNTGLDVRSFENYYYRDESFAGGKILLEGTRNMEKTALIAGLDKQDDRLVTFAQAVDTVGFFPDRDDAIFARLIGGEVVVRDLQKGTTRGTGLRVPGGSGTVVTSGATTLRGRAVLVRTDAREVWIQFIDQN
ncbi:MAG: hypothetical protein AB7P04_15510 [Bacteriovoracia bacterium]